MAATQKAAAPKKTAASAKSMKKAPDQVPAVADRPKSREGKVVISAFFDPAISREIKVIAAVESTTVQALLTEALQLLFAKRRQPWPGQ